MNPRIVKPSVGLFGARPEPTEPRRAMLAGPAPEPTEEPAPFASEATPDGNAIPIPTRLYRRQIDRLDALRKTLAPGVTLSRSAAVRFIIDHWRGGQS